MAAHQAPPSLGFSRQEHWGGLPFLLQYMKVKSESEVTQSCLTPSDPIDCSLPGSSFQGIFQARVLEWGAIAFSNFKYSECLFIPFLKDMKINTIVSPTITPSIPIFYSLHNYFIVVKVGNMTVWLWSNSSYCAVLCLVTHLCLTLFDPVDCSLPGSSVHGDSPGKNTAVGCYALFQGIFPTHRSNPDHLLTPGVSPLLHTSWHCHLSLNVLHFVIM